MNSFDVELKNVANTSNNEVAASTTTSEAKEEVLLNNKASSSYISVISAKKGLLSESLQKTFNQLNSNLTNYLQNENSLKNLVADQNSATMAHYRKLTLQVISRDPCLQEQVAQDLSTKNNLVKTKDASNELESNLKSLPKSLQEGTPTGQNLGKFICQAVVNLTDYENMGAGLQRDLAIRDVYAPTEDLSFRQKQATKDVISASIAFVKSNQPEVLSTITNEQPPKTNSASSGSAKPNLAITTPQVMTRYLRKALDEFPKDTTYLDIFKQNKNKEIDDTTASDTVSQETSRRIKELIAKAADTARKGNLIKSDLAPTQENLDQKVVKEGATNSKNVSELSLSELSARAAKLQQQFREERQRLASEGKLPDPATRMQSTIAIDRQDLNAIDEAITKEALKSENEVVKSPDSNKASSPINADEIKKIALEAVKEALKESVATQLELNKDTASKAAQDAVKELSKDVKEQLAVVNNATKDAIAIAIKEALEKNAKAQNELAQAQAKEIATKTVNELTLNVKEQIAKDTNLVIKETLQDEVKAQIDKTSQAIKETVKDELQAQRLENQKSLNLDFLQSPIKSSYNQGQSVYVNNQSSPYVYVKLTDAKVNNTLLNDLISANTKQSVQEQTQDFIDNSKVQDKQIAKAPSEIDPKVQEPNAKVDNVKVDESKLKNEPLPKENVVPAPKALIDSEALKNEQAQVALKETVQNPKAELKAQEYQAPSAPLEDEIVEADLDASLKKTQTDSKLSAQVFQTEEQIEQAEEISRDLDNEAIVESETDKSLQSNADTEDLNQSYDDLNIVVTDSQKVSTINSQSTVPGSTSINQVKDSSVNNAAITTEQKAVFFSEQYQNQAKTQELAQDNVFEKSQNLTQDLADEYDPIKTDNQDVINSNLKQASNNRPSVFSNNFQIPSENLNQSITDENIKPENKAYESRLENTQVKDSTKSFTDNVIKNIVPQQELEDSIVPSDVKTAQDSKKLDIISSNDDAIDDITINSIPQKTEGAASITSGSSEPIPNESVVEEVPVVAEKSGFFSKIASFFGAKKDLTEKESEATKESASLLNASQMQSLASKGSPLDSYTYSLRAQINNPHLPAAIRDQASKLLEKLQEPINDLPAVSNWLNFTQVPMSPSSSQAIALHQWAFFLLSIRFSQLGKSIDKLLKKCEIQTKDSIDESAGILSKAIDASQSDKIKDLVDETFDQICRFQNSAKENPVMLFDYIPLPPSYDGGREGGFNAKEVENEDGSKSWHLNFVFDLEGLGPIEIKAVAKLPELRLSVIAENLKGLEKVQQNLPKLKEHLQSMGITTTTASARLGQVHMIKEKPLERKEKLDDNQTLSVNI